ncbi:hypothetical protein NKJ74_32085 [Mesorhizobium sp. M0046]|uniref:hypothetical protein n=1 Tax=Mesorhizobium sp. M0046 TaxID=2956858 RepID=UPI0033379991
MRLMGIAKLEGLAKCGVDGMAGAVSALLSELAVTQWRTEVEFVARFPFASCRTGEVRIPMGDAHCVELIIKYDIGMVLVAFAGATAGRNTGTTGRRAA